MDKRMIKLTTTDAHLGYPGWAREASSQTGSSPPSWCGAAPPSPCCCCLWCALLASRSSALASGCQHRCCCSWQWPYKDSDFNCWDRKIKINPKSLAKMHCMYDRYKKKEIHHKKILFNTIKRMQAATLLSPPPPPQCGVVHAASSWPGCSWSAPTRSRSGTRSRALSPPTPSISCSATSASELASCSARLLVRNSWTKSWTTPR